MCVLRTQRLRGYTLAELVIVVLVIGLLGAITSLGLCNVVPAARQEAAVSRARLLNAGRLSYTLLVPGAAAHWEVASDDAERLAQLVAAGVMEPVDVGYLQLPGSYQLELGGLLSARTRVYRDGKELDYLP